MRDASGDALLGRIEEAGWTVSRATVYDVGGRTYRLTAWRTAENPDGYYRGWGPIHYAGDTDRARAAHALAKAPGLLEDNP